MTDEEYSQWWEPSDALDQFIALGNDGARETVLAMLCDGLIQAVAEKLVLAGDVTRLEPISKEIWPLVRGNGFWSTSRFRIQASKDGNDLSVSAYGIKLNPDEIKEHAPPRPEPIPFDQSVLDSLASATGATTAGQSKGKAPLPQSILDQWGEMFRSTYPQGTESEARKVFASMFIGYSVTRERLRRVLPKRKPGRPRKNKD